MTLADLRRFAIRGQFQIRFALGNGMQCVVDEHGVARVPALRGVPDFNLETELAAANEFVLEPAAPAKDSPNPRTVGRDELAAMAAPAQAAAQSAHEDE